MGMGHRKPLLLALVQASLHISWAAKQTLSCSSGLKTRDRVTHKTCAL